ncbi:MAG: M48 family metalloprotease [Gammaproteobacteria bacterium]|nr:M48 family metalloprotease [Gammaproteobacteria bacterium]
MYRHIAVLVSLLAAQSLLAQEPNLPDFGSPVDAVINKNQEAQLGRSVVAQLRGAGAILEDAQLKEFIQDLGSQLVGHANDGTQSFQFFVVDDDAINAFAVPGGFIGINSGLILASENESELAGVLAHEIAHVTQRHTARSIYDNQRTSMLSLATMIAAVLLGAATDSSDAVQGAVMAGQAGAMQRQINFTRANEREADRIGIETLASAGFNANAMATFFEKLGRRYGMAREQVPAILQTHPVSIDRIAEARERTRLLPVANPTDSMSYGLAKSRLLIHQARTPEAAHAIFESLMSNDVANPATRYGYGLSLSQLGLLDEADRLFTDLVGEHPEVIAFWIARGETLMRTGFVEAAFDVYVEAIDLFPRNVPLTISYAEALIVAGKPAEAHELLLDLLNNVPPTPEQIRLIARAANAEGDVGNSHYYMGEYYLSLGNGPLAIGQLRMALESPGVNSVDRARYQARLNQIGEWMAAE